MANAEDAAAVLEQFIHDGIVTPSDDFPSETNVPQSPICPLKSHISTKRCRPKTS